MLNKVVLVFLVSLAAQPIFADEINEAKWVCPSTVDVDGVAYKFKYLRVFDGVPENLGQLVPEHREPSFRQLDARNVYLSCEYEGLKNKLILHAKGASFCGYGANPFRAACWAKSKTAPSFTRKQE